MKYAVRPGLSSAFTRSPVDPECPGMTVDGGNVEIETKSLRMMIHRRGNDRENEDDWKR
jgi:hypothetical protein